MAQDDVYQTTLYQSMYGVSIANVWHYKETAQPVTMDAEDAINQWVESDVLPSYVAALSNQWKALCVSTVKITGGNNVPREKFFTMSNIGVQVGEGLPPNCVMCGTFYTGNFSNNGRGRAYISGWRIIDEDDNCFVNAAKVLGDAIIVALKADAAPIGEGTYDRIILSGIPAAPEPVLNHYTNPQVRKLRSRTMKACGQ